MEADGGRQSEPIREVPTVWDHFVSSVPSSCVGSRGVSGLAQSAALDGLRDNGDQRGEQGRVSMPDSNMQEWLPTIIDAVRQLGGRARLSDIYRWVELHRDHLPPEYKALVRATIYSHSTDAKAYVPGNPDVFRRLGYGEWGLRFTDETIHGRSETDLVRLVWDSMTAEERGMYASEDGGHGLFREVTRRVEIARRKYHMNDDVSAEDTDANP